MGREHKKRRSMKIKQAQVRHAKLKKLRKKYVLAKNESEKELIWEKVSKVAPWLTKEEFLKAVKDNKVTLKVVKKKDSKK